MKSLLFYKNGVKPGFEAFDELEIKSFKEGCAIDPFSMKRMHTVSVETDKGSFCRAIDPIDYTPGFIVAYSVEPDFSNWCVIYNDEDGITESEAIERFREMDLSNVKKLHEGMPQSKTF